MVDPCGLKDEDGRTSYHGVQAIVQVIQDLESFPIMKDLNRFLNHNVFSGVRTDMTFAFGYVDCDTGLCAVHRTTPFRHV
jgi:hypothetical protein